MDAAAPGLLLAQAIGRWGNYFNQELFGGPTTLPWGLQIDPNSPNFPAGMPADTLFHPTFLYESLWNLAGVVILLALDRKFNFRRSRLFWLYAIYYTLGRVWIEAMRIDDAEQINLFGITTRLNVWTSIFVLAGAVIIFIALGLRKRAEPDTVYLPGREPAAATADGDNVDAETAAAEVSDGENRDGEHDEHEHDELSARGRHRRVETPTTRTMPTGTSTPESGPRSGPRFRPTPGLSAMRTPLSQIVNPVIISELTKADQATLPRQLKRQRNPPAETTPATGVPAGRSIRPPGHRIRAGG